MANEVGIRLGVEGEKAFNASLKAVNSQIKALGAEMLAVTAAFTKNADSQEALAAKNTLLGKSIDVQKDKMDLLNKQIAAQKEKLDSLGEALDKASAEYGDQSKQALEAQNAYNTQSAAVSKLVAQLNKAEAEMNSMSASMEDNAQAIANSGQNMVDTEELFNSSLKAVNAQLKSLGAEMVAVAASFTKNANSQEALEAKNVVLGKSIDAQKSKMELLNRQIEEQREKLSDLGSALEKATAEYGENSKEALIAQKAYDQQSEKVSDLTTQLHKAEAEMHGMSDAMEDNNKALEGSPDNTSKFASALQKLGINAKGAATGIDQLASALAAAGIANTAKEIGKTLYDCVESFSKFESQMSTVQSVSGATGDEMKALSEKAKLMGSTTAFTATQAGQAFEYMAMAGWEAEDMLDGLEGIMSLAAATGEDLAQVSDIVTDGLTAFNLAASDSKRFADVLAKASSKSNTSVSMMGETFKAVAPVAGSLGYTIEDVAVAVGLMANSSIKGSSAGTALRAVLTNLAKPSKDVAAYMKALNISMTDSSGQIRPLSDLLNLLRSRFMELTEAEKTEYAAGLAGKEAMSGLLAIVNASEEDFANLTREIQNSSDAAYEMSQIRLDNYAGQVTLLESAVDGLKIAIGEQLTPALGVMANVGADAFTWATKFIEDNPWIVSAIAGLTAALGSLSVGVAALSAGPAIIKALQAALALLAANPIIAVTAAISGLVVALGTMAASANQAGSEAKTLVKSLENSKKAYEDLIDSIKGEKLSLSDTIKTLENLLAVENKSAAQKEVIVQLVSTLNEEIPSLSLAYDAASDSINITTDALERMAQSVSNGEEHNAQVERLNELYNEQTSITNQLSAAQASLDTARNAAQWDSFGGATNAAANEVERLQSDIFSLTAAQEANAAQIAELEAATNQYAEQLTNASTAALDMSPIIESITEQMQSLSETYSEVYTEAYESISGQLGLFRKMDGTAKTSIGNLIDTLEGQVAYMETYADNIQKAMELGVDEGLVQKLSDGSEESAQILAAIVKGGEEDIAKLNEQFAKVEEGKESFSTTVADLKIEFNEQMDLLVADLNDAIQSMDVSSDAKTIGENNIQGLINGTAEMKRQLVDQYTAMGQAAIAAYKKAVDQHSPSKKFQAAGRFDIQGLIGGAEGEKGKLKAAYTNLAKTAADVMAKGITGGESFTSGLADGMLSGLDTVADAAKTATNEAVKATGEAMAAVIKTVGGIEYDPDVDYSNMMLAAKDLEEFEELSAKRNAKIIGENLDLIEKGYSDNAQLLKQWQSMQVKAEEQSAKTVDALVGTVSDTLRAFLDNTPELGRQFSEQLAEGIRSGMSAVVSAAADVAKAAADTVSQALSIDIPALSADIAPAMTSESGGRDGQLSEMLSQVMQAASNGTEAIDYEKFGRTVYSSVRDGMSQMGVYLESRQVGKVVSDWQRNENMAMGR